MGVRACFFFSHKQRSSINLALKRVKPRPSIFQFSFPPSYYSTTVGRNFVILIVQPIAMLHIIYWKICRRLCCTVVRWYKWRKLDSLSFSVLATHPGFLLKRILSKGKLLIFSKTCKTDGSIILTKWCHIKKKLNWARTRSCAACVKG